MVLSDHNLVWQITQELRSRHYSNNPWMYKDWHSLSKVNAAFRSAMEDQPVALRLSKEISHEEEQAILCRRLHVVLLELQPHDRRAISMILHPTFRCSLASADQRSFQLS